MAIKSWSNVLEKGGCVLAVDSSNVFLFTVHGRSSRSAIQQIERRLADGHDPRTLDDSQLVVVPLGTLDHIDVREGGHCVGIYYHNQKTDEAEGLWFMPKRRQECENIAREIASITGRCFDESRNDVSLGSAILVPSIAAGLAAILAGTLYATASSIDAGKSVVAHGTRQGVKQLVISIATVLGLRGSIVVGALVIAVSIFWLVKNVIKRPQILTLQFTNAEGEVEHR